MPPVQVPKYHGYLESRIAANDGDLISRCRDDNTRKSVMKLVEISPPKCSICEAMPTFSTKVVGFNSPRYPSK
ncbi:hypothetical protein CEXT_68371 [Caerostris extrusa]|uniref:Uncharacterized protein n=1 Tax=Caerostris extrusa TaxID=172846 RepID=A0AAV4T4P2_CAEEX|nr:hypothetical protein CEXT_68371 [Caerostris extrusa]